MQDEAKIHSIDLKTTAFKALLQGPGVFAQFSARFGISADDVQTWLAEAGDSLNQAMGSLENGVHRASPCGSSPLLCEERRLLLGKNF